MEVDGMLAEFREGNGCMQDLQCKGQLDTKKKEGRRHQVERTLNNPLAEGSIWS